MKANLSATNFSGANLLEVDLSGADLYAANLSGAGLTRANLDNQTDLTDAVLTDTPHWYSALVNYRRHKNSFGPAGMADIGWNDFAAFKLVNWSGLRHVGDERRKRAPWRAKGDMDAATRAYTQLSKRLREVGMHEDADRFAYRAKICQRRIHFLRGHLLRWLFSWLLFVIAGYGYRPLRTLFWYVVVIFGFSLVYVNVGHVNGQPFQLGEALVFSLASFHGRGFFPGTQSLTDMSTQLAVLEATVGLFIEVIFISTFTQRYFQK